MFRFADAESSALIAKLLQQDAINSGAMDDIQNLRDDAEEVRTANIVNIQYTFAYGGMRRM